MATQLSLGAVLPTNEIGADPAAIRDFAQAVEAMGFHHLLIYDHVLGADTSVHRDLTGPYTKDDPFHEVFVTLGFIAGVTETLEMATAVLVLPQRQTALVAKQCAQLAVLSGNRFRLGIGSGWNHVEYEALGENFRNRGRRQEEQVELMRRLWSEAGGQLRRRVPHRHRGRDRATPERPDRGLVRWPRRAAAEALRADRRWLVPRHAANGRGRRAAAADARLPGRRRPRRQQLRRRAAGPVPRRQPGAVALAPRALGADRRDRDLGREHGLRPRDRRRPHRSRPRIPRSGAG